MTQREINVVQKYLNKKYQEAPNGTKIREHIMWLYDQVTHEKRERKYSAILDSNPCGEIVLSGEPPSVK